MIYIYIILKNNMVGATSNVMHLFGLWCDLADDFFSNRPTLLKNNALLFVTTYHDTRFCALMLKQLVLIKTNVGGKTTI